jgi:hypothetical protein
MRSGGSVEQQWASMTSSPLFISVAESTEILRPIDQFGWRAGLVRRHAAQLLRGVSRNGPPEAVSSIAAHAAARHAPA